MFYLYSGFYSFDLEDKTWALFSTISANLEPDGWGTKYPVLLNNFVYDRKISGEQLVLLRDEIDEIYAQLKKVKIKDLVLDYTDRTEKLHLVDQSLEQRDLLDYFKLSVGNRNLMDSFVDAIQDAISVGDSLELRERKDDREFYNGVFHSIYIGVGTCGYSTDGKLGYLINTIWAVLEPAGKGSKFPNFTQFYNDGVLDVQQLTALKKEIEEIYGKLKTLKIKDIVLDCSNRDNKIVCNEIEQEQDPLLKFFEKEYSEINLLDILLRAINKGIEENIQLEIRNNSTPGLWYAIY